MLVQTASWYEWSVGLAAEIQKTVLEPISAMITGIFGRLQLSADGVTVAVNFWIKTNESKPLEVLERAAIAIVRVLDEAGIEVFPPGSMIVQRPKEEVEEQIVEEKRKEIFDPK